jgi:hypothetical protein
MGLRKNRTYEERAVGADRWSDRAPLCAQYARYECAVLASRTRCSCATATRFSSGLTNIFFCQIRVVNDNGTIDQPNHDIALPRGELHKSRKIDEVKRRHIDPTKFNQSRQNGV